MPQKLVKDNQGGGKAAEEAFLTASPYESPLI